MDNNTFNQPTPVATPTPATPVMPQAVMTPNAAIPATPEQITETLNRKADHSGLIKTIVIIALSLLAATFIGLFIWMTFNYNDAKTDLDLKIEKAVTEAVDDKVEELEDEFAEREKDPYKTFAGPIDYGELSFKYPKTWSVYIAKDASRGGNFEAYMNPGEVNTVSQGTINSLRVIIRDESYEDVVAGYQRDIDNKNLTMTSITVNGVTANRYTGVIPGTELNGFIVVFKIRDKTAILQTDSTLFKEDFDTLIGTVKFNA